jgi:hypothetical protein
MDRADRQLLYMYLQILVMFLPICPFSPSYHKRGLYKRNPLSHAAFSPLATSSWQHLVSRYLHRYHTIYIGTYAQILHAFYDNKHAENKHELQYPRLYTGNIGACVLSFTIETERSGVLEYTYHPQNFKRYF